MVYTGMTQKITPNLWFDTEAEEAAEFYTSVFKDGRILNKTHYTEGAPREAGMVMTVDWEVAGMRFTGINGGPDFHFNESVSFLISCEDQDEVDYYWDRLGDGGKEIQCGWVTDRFGLAWQVVPAGMDELFADPDPERAKRAMEAMLRMKKLDIAALRAAADGAPAN
jgi:predicted 3-demethylubiquinone-9 3-methyltransferase (glyoxalase superfamily)